jgi:hypothetical protein
MSKNINNFTNTLKPPKMKKSLFLLMLILCTIIGAFGQTIEINDSNKVTVDISNSKYPVITQTRDSILPSGANPMKSTKVWFEAGNGYFSTIPVTNHPVTGRQQHVPLLMATNLYDTTRDIPISPPSIITSETMILTLGNGVNSSTEILRSNGIKITPNAYDVVPGDPMAFAISYKIPESQIDRNPKLPVIEKTYKIYFLYNNNRTFDSITNTSNESMLVGGLPFFTCRRHNNEIPTYNTTINPGINPNNSLNWVCFTNIKADQYREKNVFVSLKPFDNLEIGKSGSVYAILTTSDDVIIATDSIVNMAFLPAHDPNYLVQQPYCLLFPKKIYPFNYTVHFQNTGEGNAKEVKVVIQLPKGMDFGSLKIKKASFAGADYTKTIRVSKDLSLNQVVVIFISDTIRGQIHELLGTALSPQPATDPKTMGEVQFTLNSTPNTENEMSAFADIYFRSVHPSDSLAPDGYYEKPVRTNTGVTKYKNSCNTCRDCPTPCKKFLGLCWWWWIIIFSILMLIIYILLRRRKKEYKNQQYE